MVYRLSEHTDAFAVAIQKLEELHGHDDEARRQVCQRSRFVWLSVRAATRSCYQPLTPKFAARIDGLFQRALSALELGQAGYDVFRRNVDDRYKGDEGIKPVLDEAIGVVAAQNSTQ